MLVDDKQEPALNMLNKAGRGEISDFSVIIGLNLSPDEESFREIRELEEASILAEQRLGNLRVA